MKQKVAILIPIYQPDLQGFEEISVQRCFEVLGNYPIIFVAPQNLDVSHYQRHYPRATFVFFDADYFTSVKKYSKLMTRPFFYRHFLNFEYILIYQTDVFIFRDELLAWCGANYDYIGAPWMRTDWMNEFARNQGVPYLVRFLNRVGNGGFSLRKVKRFYQFSQLYAPLTKNMKLNEDIFWSNNPARFVGLFKIPPPDIALQFAFEELPRRAYEQNNQHLPFGVHAWQKYDLKFWRPHLEKFGYTLNHE